MKLIWRRQLLPYSFYGLGFFPKDWFVCLFIDRMAKGTNTQVDWSSIPYSTLHTWLQRPWCTKLKTGTRNFTQVLHVSGRNSNTSSFPAFQMYSQGSVQEMDQAGLLLAFIKGLQAYQAVVWFTMSQLLLQILYFCLLCFGLV